MASSSKQSAGKANLLGKRKLEDGLETKPILKKHNEKETTKGFAEQNKARVELSETKSDEANLITVKEAVTVRNKTLFVTNLPPETEISDIIDFFKDVGQVVRVRLVINHNDKFLGCGFVEFPSAKEANKALQKNNGEYLHKRNIFMDVANRGAAYLPPPKYYIDHKVWYEEDYFQGPIEEVEGLHEKVLLVTNLSPQTTRIAHIVDFFTGVGEVVSVRLIVNQHHKHVGYCFVEFASSYEAKRALEERNGEFLHDHKILLMKGLDKTPDSVEEAVEGVDETPTFVEAVSTVKNKTLFVTNLSPETEISDVIDFFKDVGQVVRVRLIVDQWCKLRGYGFVEFASANKANKALKKKNGEYLHDSEIMLDVVDNRDLLQPPTYCLDYMVWCEDYLQQESLQIEEDAVAVEGLDETPDFLEEVALRKKRLFIVKLARQTEKSDIINFFKDVAHVVHVRLILDHIGTKYGYVEFASANEAKKALKKKNGEYLHYCKIILDETPDFFEEVAIRKKTVFVAKHYDNSKISKLLKNFSLIGEIVRVRFIVNQWGEQVGCYFVEFASANDAKNAVYKWNGPKFFVHLAEMSDPYPFRPKCNLVEKLWYEDNLRRESLDLEPKPSPKKQKVIFGGKWTTFCDQD